MSKEYGIKTKIDQSMPEIISTKYYDKKLLQFKSKHPELREKYIKTIKIFGIQPFASISATTQTQRKSFRQTFRITQYEIRDSA